MHSCNPDRCNDCPARLVCHCLRVTEDVIRDAVAAFDIQTIHELRAHTGAGDGCTACHSRLEEFLEAYGRVRLAADSCSAAR